MWSASPNSRPAHPNSCTAPRRSIILSGECDLELDDGKTVHLKQGDIVVQRGTMHAWVNNGSAPCVFAFILIDADPVEASSGKLTTHYPVG